MRKKLRLLKSQYDELNVELKKGKIKIKGLLGEGELENRVTRKGAGSFFSFLQQECIGVSFGFFVSMYLHGIGYKVWCSKDRKKLLFKLGYNHLIKFKLSSTMQVYTRKSRFVLFGMDKQEVNIIANRIMYLRKPDSYKGKGIRYTDKILALKETKDAKKK
jgi:large subunit ribosomal protein L6